MLDAVDEWSIPKSMDLFKTRSPLFCLEVLACQHSLATPVDLLRNVTALQCRGCEVPRWTFTTRFEAQLSFFQHRFLVNFTITHDSFDVCSFSFPICRDTIFFFVVCRIWRLLRSSVQQVSSKRESPSVLRTLVETFLFVESCHLLPTLHRILLRNCPFEASIEEHSRCSKNSFICSASLEW
jgi:hypothetical protein